MSDCPAARPPSATGGAKTCNGFGRDMATMTTATAAHKSETAGDGRDDDDANEWFGRSRGDRIDENDPVLRG
jgi:hypothetical protein